MTNGQHSRKSEHNMASTNGGNPKQTSETSMVDSTEIECISDASGNLYLGSSVLNPKRGKVGYSSNGMKELTTRYMTQVPDFIIHSFFFSPVAKIIEKEMKIDWVAHRKTNTNGNASEWYLKELPEVFDELMKIKDREEAVWKLSNIDTSCIVVSPEFKLDPPLYVPARKRSTRANRMTSTKEKVATNIRLVIEKVEPLPYHEIPSIKKEELSIDELSVGCAFNGTTGSSYEDRVVEILLHKRKSGNVSYLEGQTLERYWFDHLMELRFTNRDPSKVYDSLWKDKNKKSTFINLIFLLSGRNVVRERLRKVHYFPITTRSVKRLDVFYDILKQLSEESQRNLFNTNVVIELDTFHRTIGKHIEANEKIIREFWGLRNREITTTINIFRSILKSVGGRTYGRENTRTK